MNKNSVEVKNGLGIFSALTIAFIILRLTDKIDWSWWWVLAPLWAPPILWIAAMGLITFICNFKTICKRIRCLLTGGHQYKNTLKKHESLYGFSTYHVKECQKCGKIKENDR